MARNINPIPATEIHILIIPGDKHNTPFSAVIITQEVDKLKNKKTEVKKGVILYFSQFD